GCLCQSPHPSRQRKRGQVSFFRGRPRGRRVELRPSRLADLPDQPQIPLSHFRNAGLLKQIIVLWPMLPPHTQPYLPAGKEPRCRALQEPSIPLHIEVNLSWIWARHFRSSLRMRKSFYNGGDIVLLGIAGELTKEANSSNLVS